MSKFLLGENYVTKIIPLVEMSEDLESLPDLHRLCNVMKSLILLNDNAIIEHLVSDEIITGAVGALEYDPDFPTHKANHRQYLNDTSRYKEVVPILDPLIQNKIRYTWRLQYLKDVVLARILDDPTFSVLNSIIFFNQVEIVQHLQTNTTFLQELFAVFDPDQLDVRRKEDALHFLHQCAAIAKNLQAQSRADLFTNFINHGLFDVITFAVKHPTPATRTTGIDILVALLDHDPTMMREYMLQAVREKQAPLTDTMLGLLHADLGVRNQLADAIKILLDPQAPSQEPTVPPNAAATAAARAGGDLMVKVSPLTQQQPSPLQTADEQFAQDHFDCSCEKLFYPLRDLEHRPSMQDFTYQDVSLHTHLVEILTYFVRSHPVRSRHFVLSGRLSARVAQLLQVCQKPLKLTALKFFRTCVSLQDQFYVDQMIENDTFALILDVVLQTLPRDNLLNSACLEMFEFVKRENVKNVIVHVVSEYHDKIKDIRYVDTFQTLITRYEQMQQYGAELEMPLFPQDEQDTPLLRAQTNGGHRWQGIKEMDPEQEDYFNTSDDEDDEEEEEENGPDGDALVDSVEAAKARLSRFEYHARRLKMGGYGSMNGTTAKSAANNNNNNSTNRSHSAVNGAGAHARRKLVTTSPTMSTKPLVDYPDDEDDMHDNLEVRPAPIMTPQTPGTPESIDSDNELPLATGLSDSPRRRLQPSPDIPERISEKRRRVDEDEDDQDELSKLSTGIKRRNSTNSHPGSTTGSTTGSLAALRRRRSFLKSKQQQQQQQHQQHQQQWRHDYGAHSSPAGRRQESSDSFRQQKTAAHTVPTRIGVSNSAMAGRKPKNRMTISLGPSAAATLARSRDMTRPKGQEHNLQLRTSRAEDDEDDEDESSSLSLSPVPGADESATTPTTKDESIGRISAFPGSSPGIDTASTSSTSNGLVEETARAALEDDPAIDVADTTESKLELKAGAAARRIGLSVQP